MRTFSAEALAALDSGRFGYRCLLKVLLDESTFAIWDDIGTITVGGVDYVGAAGRFTVQMAPGTYDLAARPTIVTLSGLDSAAVALIDSTPWHQRPIVISRAIIATEAPAVLYVAEEFSGRIDQAPNKMKVGDAWTLEFTCETEAIENARSGGSTRSDADQRARDSGDGFFSFSASAKTTTFDWGRQPQQAQPKPKNFLAKLFG